MKIWLLDTNTISAAVHRRSETLDERLLELGALPLRVSAISYGEVQFGLAQKPAARHLARSIADFFRNVQILDWTESTAEVYGTLRADMKKAGKALSPLDMLIAAHALEAHATLVTSDRAFRFVPGLDTVDWIEA
ncbi:type II toxin-antitoxin system VapC family toxin [Mesorhizobium sp. CAU 1732]|uniref:type II toxin-antitoxin system VapC family toxin n=1 Tax=Mesorhizobium sp. CAU 1732 TaxID=3140358 RepID=UPI0032602D6A